MSSKNRLSISILKLLVLFIVSFYSFTAQSQVIKVEVTFDQVPSSFAVRKAPLKYNKDFAYSLTLDDTSEDGYTAAFFFLKGGLVRKKEQHSSVYTDYKTYPGLFYTDGCGNSIPFKAGLAWFTVNGKGVDLHNNNPGFISWTQLKVIHAAGWDVLNHSFSHAANKGEIDYNFQVAENLKVVKEKTGIEMSHFVIPSGDIRYIEPALNYGMKAIYNQSTDFMGSAGLRVDNLTEVDKLKVYRRLLADDNSPKETIMNNIDNIANKSLNDEKYWWNEYTHRVGFYPTGASLIFNTFEYYMQTIEQKYGKSGKDNVWMAPFQEVHEYVTVRENTSIESKLNGKVLTISVDVSKVPPGLRRNALTLVIDSDVTFSDVKIDGVNDFKYNGKGINKIINLEMTTNEITNAPIEQKKISDKKFSIYPNPAQAQDLMLTINNTKPSEEFSIILNHITGKQIYTQKVIATTTGEYNGSFIPETPLAKGVYLVTVLSKTSRLTQRLVVK